MSEIPNFPNYLIYRDGRVWSKISNKFMKPNLTKGYLTHCLFNKCGRKYLKLHRLLGLTFIPNSENKPCIDHIDRNTLNNNLDNLRWATHRENLVNQNVKGIIKERFILYSGKSLRIRIKINGSVVFSKTNKNWTLEQAVNVRNIVLKFLKFTTTVD